MTTVIILIPIAVLLLVGLALYYQHRRGYTRCDITLKSDECRWERYYRKGRK